MYEKDIKRLREQGKSYREIQDELGCSKGTISYHVGEGQKNKTLQRSQKRRTEMRSVVAKIKEDSGCVDCNQKYPYFVLDFDHVRGTKKDGVAQLITWGTLEEIYEEIDKCDIVCANCHRVRTQNRRENKKYKIDLS